LKHVSSPSGRSLGEERLISHDPLVMFSLWLLGPAPVHAQAQAQAQARHRAPSEYAPAYEAPLSAPPVSTAPLADAFSNLLAVEEGRPGASLHSAVSSSLPPNTSLTDDAMDAIVDRVIARLGSGVRGAVLDLAERLVRAEIDRLKAIR
nr:hypothetical protein [Acidobacteriota bacterium]